jgi:2-polyprenyl-6-methoxyphenol hydroxylase-like FAD-dependent oxidoreductase
MLEPGLEWEHKKGLTLIGAAAYLMTPFAGDGVNLAMVDALELAQGIISAWGKDILDDAVRDYEKKMFPRAKIIAKETWRNREIIFEKDAPRGFVELMTNYVHPPVDN